MFATQKGGFSWQVAPDLRIGAIYRTPTTVDVALFEDSQRKPSGAPWSPDYPFDRNHGVFEVLQRHCGDEALHVLRLLNGELATLHQEGSAR